MFNKLRLRLRAVFHKNSMEEELESELCFHLEKEIEENIARGMSQEDARQVALRNFGDVPRVKEESRDERGIRLAEELWQNLRYAARMMLKNPGFTLTAVMTLALGIGAASVIFSFVNGILLRPLPFRDSDRLVLLDENASKRGIASMGVSYPDFLDWREQNRVFTGIAAYDGGWDYTLTGIGEPEELLCSWISYNAFEILGVAPILGRTFTAEEEHWKSGLVVILSHDLWRRRFDAKPDVIGRTIALNTRPHTVIGVAPPGFKFPKTADLWVPMAPIMDNRS